MGARSPPWKRYTGEEEKMIVEVFIKGNNFKNHYDTFWNIKSINRSGDYFVLVTEDEKEDNIVFNTDKYELRVTY